MGVFAIRRKGIFYIVDKIKGKIVNKFSTGIEVPDNGRVPKIVTDKIKEYEKQKILNAANKKKILCSEFKKQYLELCKPPKKRPRTYESIQGAFKVFIEDVGDRELHEYTERDIDQFLSKKIEKSSEHTAHRIRRTLRPAWKRAIRWGYISKNPWEGSIDIELPEPDPKFMSLEEFERMLLFCDNEVLADALTWIYYTGVRASEFIKTKPTDVRIKVKLIDVLSTEDAPNKDKATRSIEMHSRLIPIYEKYKTQEYLFLNPNAGNKPYSHRALLDGITRACKAAQLEHYTIQNLRSSYGSRLLDKDVPLEWISGQLGHSDTRVTRKHYIKKLAGKYQGIVEKLD